ncbi:MAG: phosphohistidine phosphatase [Rhodothermales bacterium]|jgi:phosphohistidine phosphatase
MKSIYILRHAKSDWNANYGEDHDRPLAPRGEAAAARVGRLLRDTNNVPDLIFSSTAVRARTTVHLASEAGDWGRPIELRPELYGAGVETILEIAHGLPDSIESALFAGHQPGWSYAVSALSGGGMVSMPTACLARIDFEVRGWQSCRVGGGVLSLLIPPKGLD